MRPTLPVLLLALGLPALVACTPTVQVKAPEKLVIDMNLKIDHEVRVRVERDLEETMRSDEEIF
jgi:hypothetical protein